MKKLNKAIISVGVASSLALTTCVASDFVKSNEVAVDGGVKYEVKDGKYTAYYVNTQDVKFNNGRVATKNEINAWNVDVMPDGTGLPEYDMHRGQVVMEDGKPKKAEGSVAWGMELYEAQCQMCHGDFGAGGKGYPALSGGKKASLTNQLMNPADANPGIEPPRKVIGSYWPYQSTLFWYIQDSMPFPHPKSLSNSETYAISAYLLYENGVKVDGEEMDEEFVMDREKYLKVMLPNHDGFYPQVDTPDNPHQGVKNMTEFLANPENYGKGTRCMKDCIKGKVPVMRIAAELNDFNPPASTVRDLPPVVESGPVHPGKAGYENNCAVCHGSDAMGAPVVGDKDAWEERLVDGIDRVYANGINGINGMPPKGGASISDEEFKQIVDYMIDASK
ncbi:MAG: c-type cytochrome [Campylobacterales bacterium]|nr:c-type cytochrome [Campylobacterales bacterium]